MGTVVPRPARSGFEPGRASSDSGSRVIRASWSGPYLVLCGGRAPTTRGVSDGTGTRRGFDCHFQRSWADVIPGERDSCAGLGADRTGTAGRSDLTDTPG